MNKDSLFDLEDQVAVLTGAGGVLVGAMSQELARRGVRVAIMDREPAAAQRVCEEIRAEGGFAEPIICDVLNKDSLQGAAGCVMETFGRVDILVNGAGGNHKNATTSPDLGFFDIPAGSWRSRSAA